MKNAHLMMLLVAALGLGAVACGTDDADPILPGTGGTGGNTGGTGGNNDGGTGGSGGDDEPCVNQQATCDECVSWEQNPYLACSEFTAGCVPFDNAGRVPGFPNFPRVP